MNLRHLHAPLGGIALLLVACGGGADRPSYDPPDRWPVVEESLQESWVVVGSDPATAPATGPGGGVRVDPGIPIAAQMPSHDWRAVDLTLSSAAPGRVSVAVAQAGVGMSAPRVLETGPTPSEHRFEVPPGWKSGLAGALGLQVEEGGPAVEVLASALTMAQVPPNLILIIVDTLRGDAVFDDQGRALTPGLATLAEDGVVFTRCFSHAPMTLSSHASLFSSRAPFESGVLRNGLQVPEELPLLAEALDTAGYTTSAAVSISPLYSAPGKGLRRGFELYRLGDWGLSYAEAAQPRIRDSLDGLASDQPVFFFAHYADPHAPYRGHGEEGVPVVIELDGRELGRTDTVMAESWTETVRLTPGEHTVRLASSVPFVVLSLRTKVPGSDTEVAVERDRDAGASEEVEAVLRVPGSEPLDVELSVWANDLLSNPRSIERYRAEVAHVDRFVGELLADLKARGLYDDSLIVFTSDHGEGLGEHNWLVHAENVYDEQLHVPLVIKLPRSMEGGEALAARRNDLVRHMDVVPTVLELLRLPPLPGQRGASLLRDGERLLIAQTHKPVATHDLLCMRDERFKLIYNVGEDRFEMYDVVADPDEQEDVFDRRGDERKAWVSALRRMGALTTDMAEGLESAEGSEAARAELEALGYGGGE